MGLALTNVTGIQRNDRRGGVEEINEGLTEIHLQT